MFNNIHTYIQHRSHNNNHGSDKTIPPYEHYQTNRSGYLHANAYCPINVTVLRETEEHIDQIQENKMIHDSYLHACMHTYVLQQNDKHLHINYSLTYLCM